ncbi:hypothetical protein Tco_0980925 [Tanacetum coccineum]
MHCHVILFFSLFKSSNSHTSLPPSSSSSTSPSLSMSCSNHHSNFSRKPRMSVRQVWKRKTSTPKSSPSSQKDSPPLPPRVYLQSPSPPSYNPLRDQMINQLHNISTILDSHTNPSNAYIHAPPSPPPQPIHPPSHAQVHNFVSVMEVEPDIENITLEEYLKYESKKGRRFWKSVLSKGSPIRYEGADFNSFYHDKSDALEYWDSDMEIIDDVYYKLPPLEPCFQTSHPYNKSGFVSPNENDEIDIDRLDGVPDNLFKIGAENLRKMKQEKVQVVECDGGKLEEIWDITVEDVESLRKLITPIPFISQTIYTTPPDDAYVVSDTKPILDELLEEFRDKLLKIAVFDEEADCNPVKDIKELLCIMKTNVELESFIQQLNPLHGEIQSSKLSTKTGKKRRK